jgi:hypothetical protein
MNTVRDNPFLYYRNNNKPAIGRAGHNWAGPGNTWDEFKGHY